MIESQQRLELINRQARLPYYCTQGPFGHFFVIRDRETPMRGIYMPQDDMTASLVV